MKPWRPLIWLLVSIACFVAAFYFWRWGDRQQARQARPKAPPQAAAQNAKPPARVSARQPISRPASTSPMASLPSALGKPPVTNAVPRQFPFRVSNTTSTLAQLERDSHGILLENALIDSSRPLDGLAIPDALRAKGDPGSYIVQARGPVDDAFRSALKNAGATIVSYIPNNAYLVTASAAAVQAVAAQSGAAVIPFQPLYKVKSGLLESAINGQPVGAVNIGVFPGKSDETKAALQKLGVTVVSESPSPFGTEMTLVGRGSSLLGLMATGPAVAASQRGVNVAAVAQLPGVAEIEPYSRRIPANDLSRTRIGVSADTQTSTNYLNLTGAGVLVNVNDEWEPDEPGVTGTAPQHPDLVNRILSPWSGGFFMHDFTGHPTHVTGIIAGDGTESTTVTNASGSINPGVAGQYRGMAPKADIWALPIGDNDNDGDDIYSDFDLQQLAAKTNAFISNNSWGYGDTTYDLAAASYDAAVRDALPYTSGSQPVLFVFAAGNNGNGSDDGRNGNADSIASPGTAKNVLTVGAIEQLRNITNDVSKCDVCQTNLGCSTNQPWAGMTDSSNEVASFSSRGNVGVGIEGDFGRFKPDVVAPGTFVVSTRSMEWDEPSYYDPTNYDFRTFLSTIGPNSIDYNQIFVPCGAVQLSIFAYDPLMDLPIYVQHDALPTFSSYYALGTNEVDIPGPGGTPPLTPTDTTWFYGVTNSTTDTIQYQVATELVTTNDFGDQFQVLSNLNDSIGTGNYYRYESGTSMAAPAVSGMLALMQEFFQDHGMTNSPALMKALVINGARPVNAIYDYQVDTPMNFQGWGLVNLTNSLPVALSSNTTALATMLANGPSPVLAFDQSPTNALATGDSRTFTIHLDPDAQGAPLRVTLVWTDPPGNPAAGLKLVNNLDLVVTNTDPTDPGFGQVFFGNDIQAGNDFNQPWDTNTAPNWDMVNNVENIYLQQPLASSYSITVIGRAVNVNAVTAHTNGVVQDYALVVSSGNGDDGTALTVTNQPPIVQNNTPNVTTMTNAFPSGTGIVGGLLSDQRVGASSPLQGLNTLALGAVNQDQWGTNGQITLGVTNQWHFYVISNDPGNVPDAGSFTNAAFVTFMPPNLATPRMGVNADSVGDSSRVEADIDLYVANSRLIANASGLTNLDPAVVSAADKSLSRGGTEFIVYSNAQPGDVFYIGVKSEDQQAAQYGFAGLFSDLPFSSSSNGVVYVRGVPVPQAIPDGSPQHPGVATVLGINPIPVSVRRVVVTNIMEHENFGDLFGTLSHSRENVVLNNHTFGNGDFYQQFVYDDNAEGDIPGAQHTDGPGSLTDFIGQQGSGVWLMNEVDNALVHTGRIDYVSIRLDPQQNTNNSATFNVQPDSWAYDFIDVPAEATNLTISVVNNSANPLPVQLYVRYGALPTTAVYDYTKTINPPGGSLSIGLSDLPPLSPGTYYIGIFNPNGTMQTVTLSWTLGLNLAGVVPTDFRSTGSTPLLDDAVATNTIMVTNDAKIFSVNVGVVLKHPRVSDLALTLISPSGKRIVLMENRGGPGAADLGGGTVITNLLPTTSSGGGSNANTNTIGPVPNSGTLLIDYNFETVPDTMDVYYDGVDIFSSGSVSGTGQFTVQYGPGLSTNIVIVMNQNGNPNSTTLWSYTPTDVTENYSYFTFTEDTNLTQVPVKYALPPYSGGSTNSTTNFISGFESPVVAGNYGSGQTVDGWTVQSGQVSVLNNAALADSGQQSLALGMGTITRTLPTQAGNSYLLVHAYRQNQPPDINGSFETPVMTSSIYANISTNVGGWIVGYGNVDMISSSYWQPAQGNQSIDLNGNTTGSLYRDIPTINGAIYDLSYAHSANPDGAVTNYDLHVLWSGVLVTNATFFPNGISRTNMGWVYATNQVTGTGTNQLLFESVIAGAAGPALDDVVLTPRANAVVTAGGVTSPVLTGSQSWQTQGVPFVASANGTPVTVQAVNGGGGMLLDSFYLVQLGSQQYVLPEESLQSLVGDNAKGTWTLEIRDTRTGAYLTGNVLNSWQLAFIFENASAVPTHLVPGVAGTNNVPPCSLAYFTVDVPSWAKFATNVVVSASAPVNLWFNQTNAPVGTNPPDFELLTGAVAGQSAVLGTNTIPPLVPGNRYFLAVENPCSNGTNVSVSIRVDYDITALSNGVPFSSTTASNDAVRYFSYDVSPAANAVSFRLFNLSGNVDLVARKGTPLPDLSSYDYGSFNSGTNAEQIVVVSNSTPVALSPGTWYLGVFNRTGSNVNYTIEAQEFGPPNIIPLINDVPVTNTAGPGAALTNFYSFTITTSPSAALFELYNLSGNGDLTLDSNTLPYAPPYFAFSANPGTAPEQIVIRTNVLGSDINGTWYLAVPNNEIFPITYTIRASLPTNGMLISALPLDVTAGTTGGGGLQLTWNSVAGETYDILTNGSLTSPNWGVFTQIVASGSSTTFTASTAPAQQLFYRIQQVP